MAINIIRKCGETKFSLFQGGPGMMEVNRLTDDVNALKERMLTSRDINTTNPFDHYPRRMGQVGR